MGPVMFPSRNASQGFTGSASHGLGCAGEVDQRRQQEQEEGQQEPADTGQGATLTESGPSNVNEQVPGLNVVRRSTVAVQR